MRESIHLKIFKYHLREQAVLAYVIQNYRKKAIITVEPLIKDNNSYIFNEKDIRDILKENQFHKKESNFDNYHKEAIERKPDKLLAEKPRNCIEQVTLSYSASIARQNRCSVHQKWR